MNDVKPYSRATLKRHVSYIVGFLISLGLTILSYWLVTEGILPKTALLYTVVTLAVVQLIVQLVFFLHIGQGKGARWKLVTFIFAIMFVFILVIGSIWIMNNLNYNMMQMTPDQEKQYMQNNEGI